MKNTKDGEQDATAVAHVSSGGPVQAIVGKGTIKMTCVYMAKTGVRLRVYGLKKCKEVREKLRQLVPTTDTENTAGAHPCGS